LCINGSRSLLLLVHAVLLMPTRSSRQPIADAERVPAAVGAATTTSTIPSGEPRRPTAAGHHGGRLRPQLEPEGTLAHAAPRHAELKPRRPWARCRGAPPPTSWLGRSAQTALCRSCRRTAHHAPAHERSSPPALSSWVSSQILG